MAPRYKDVRLALDDEEGLRPKQSHSEREHISRTPEIETGHHQKTCRDGQKDRPAPEHCNRREDQRPHALIIQGENQRYCRADCCSRQIDDRRFPELQVTGHQRFGKNEEGRRKIDQRLPAQHLCNDRFAIICSSERGCHQQLDQRQRSVDQQQHAEGLSDSSGFD